MTAPARPASTRPTSAASTVAVSAGSTPVTPLHVVASSAGVDLSEAERAAGEFLAALGVCVGSGARAETPRRMARAYAEMLSPRSFELTTFANEEGYDELVLARNIPVHSVCEHHMLPFLGVAHVGYLPGQRILGLSKLARVVELFARRPQVQERLTVQIADLLQTHLQPRGVGVVVEAEHLCMTLRGVRTAGGPSTITSTLLGTLREDPRSRAEFLTLTTRTPSTPAGGRHG
jgi:GTP cyclohydrolase IA